MTRTDDRGLAALAEALDSGLNGPSRSPCSYPGCPDLHLGYCQYEREDIAAAILGDRAVFWPTGTEEYRELIHQYQAEIERLQEQIARQAVASPELAAAFAAVRAEDRHPYTCTTCRGQWWNPKEYVDHLPTCPRDTA